MDLILTLAWLASAVYSTIPSFWLLIHPRADYWRGQRRSPYLVLVPVWLAMWIAAALVTSPWRRVLLYHNRAALIPAALLFGVGIWIYIRGGRGFSLRQLGGLPELQPSDRGQRLVTSGIRARVRHPLYLAHLLEMLAWSVGTGLVVCYALSLFALVTGAVMVRSEDAELEARFGNEYREYRRRVPAVWPRL